MDLVYTTISGHRITFPEPDDELRSFLKRVRVAKDDPMVSENDLIALVYGPDNPLLAPGIVPGRGMVTRETLANPIYRILTDLIDRKRMDEKGIAIQDIAARFTMPVSAAAEALGISSSAVLQAIAAGRLPSWLKDGKHLLPPTAVAAFKPERRGPQSRAVDMVQRAMGAGRSSAVDLVEKATRMARPRGIELIENATKIGQPPKAVRAAIAMAKAAQPGSGYGNSAATEYLSVRAGGARGFSLRVKARELADEEKDGRCVRGRIRSPWSRVGVIYGKPEKPRFVVLEPSDEENSIGAGNGELYVKGRFRIAETVNNKRAALAAWKSFEAQ